MMHILDKLRDVTNALIVKAYRVRTSNTLVSSIVNEVGYGLELVDCQLANAQCSYFAKQEFELTDLVVCRSQKTYDGGYPGAEGPAVIVSVHPEKARTYGIRFLDGAYFGEAVRYYHANELRKA